MASTATVGILRVLLSANTAEFDAAMKRAASSADAWSKNLKSIGQQATNVGMTLTKALTVPLLGIGVGAAKAAMDFESSFAGIRKTVDGVVDSSGNLTEAGKQMAQSMRDLAKTIPVNVNDLNRLGEAAGALGIPRDKVVDFTAVMAKLGVTTNLTADQAADAIARIQNIFGAAGQNTDRLASTLVALGNAGASTEKEIVEMAQRIAGAGHTVGLTQAQVLGFASTLASVGINAEAGGSAISRVFLKINDAVAKGGKGLDEFARVAGMSAAQFKTAFQTDAAGATTAFIEGLSRIKASGENVNGVIEGLVGKNIILKDTLLRVSGAGDLLRTQLNLANQAWQDNTALTKEAEQRFRTTEQQLKLLWGQIRDVGIILGNALLPAIQGAVHAVNALLPLVAGLADAFGNLPGPVQAAVIGLGLVAAAAGPVIYGFGQIAISASGLIGVFGKKGIATRLLATELVGLSGAAGVASTTTGLLASALGVLTSPITLTVAGVGLLALTIYKVVTAETDLEKQFRSGSAEFTRHTITLENALKTYTELSQKQNLTTEESIKLAQATKQLADASGLSTEAFKKEAASSSQVTDALRQQLATRKELMAEAVKSARQNLSRIEDEINKAQADLAKVLSGEATKAETSGGTGGGGVIVRGLSAEERLKEIARLNGAIAGLKKTADEARGAYQQLVGPLTAAQAAIVDKSLGKSAEDLKKSWQGVAGIFINGVVPALKQGGAAAKATGQEISLLAQLQATYVEDLKKIGTKGFAEIKKIHEEFGTNNDLEKLAKQYGVAESSVRHYIDTVKDSAKATKEIGKEAKEATEFIFEFNKETKALEDSMAKMDAAAEKAFTHLKDKGIEDLNDEARKMVDKWKKAGEEAGQKLVEGLAKSNKKWLDDASAVQRGLVGLEKDSLSKRQELIRLEFDDKRRHLDKFSTFYQANLDLLNAEEAKALAESEQQWKQSQQRKAEQAIDALAQAFSQLAQVSGGDFGGIVQDIAEVVSALSLATKASNALQDSFDAVGAAFSDGFDLSSFAQGVAQMTAAVAASVAAIASATDPTHRSTAQTTLGGAAAGAKIGATPALAAATGGLSIAVGAGIGALVGWWRGAHAEWKKVAKDIGKDIGQDISDGLAQQIAEMEKTLEGGTKQQRREWAELFSLDAIIAEAGGLKSENVVKYEKQAAKLFEIIQRGGELGAKATQELNTLIGEFGSQAAKTGGMWDPVFKSLIAKSKELGINIDGVTAAIDGQISKLSGGLGSAVKGAFAGTDKGLEDLVKGLGKAEADALADGFKHAQEAGFKGTLQDFFVQQANLYGTAMEGDSRLKTWFSGDTIAKFKALLDGTQGAFDRLSRTALASFNAIVASGRSVFDAITQIGPAIDQLIAEHDKLGLAGGAAYDQLARFRNLTTQNADLVASVSGLNDVMVALANLGGLNIETLQDLETQGLQAFDQLQAAGFTQEEALKQLQPLLKSIIQAHYDLGIPIDENTQKVIDLAKANGMLEDDSMSMVDVLKEGLGALIKGFGFDLPDAFKKTGKAAKDAAAVAKGAIDEIPTNIEITVDYVPGEVPEGVDPRHRYAKGGLVPEYHAIGGPIGGALLKFPPKGTDTVPAMLTPGELVVNAAQQAKLAAVITSAAMNAPDLSRLVDQMAALAEAVARVATVLDKAKTADFGDDLTASVMEAQEAIKHLTWADFIRQGSTATDAAEDVASGLSGIQDTLIDAGSAADDFGQAFGNTVVGNVDATAGSVNGLRGSVQNLSGDARATAGAFGESFSGARGVRGSIDASGGSVSTLRGSVQGLGGDASVTASVFGESFAGAAGIRGSVDASRGSVDGLRGGVRGVGGDATNAATQVATGAAVIVQSYLDAAGSADTLRGRIGDIVDANGNVVRSLSAEPWMEWSSTASRWVAALIAKVDVLITKIADAQRALITMPPVPGSTSPNTGGGVSTGPTSGTTPTTPHPIPGGTIPPPSRGGIPGPIRTGYQFSLGGLVPDAQPLAMGGMGRLIRFVPKGTDIVPAMLTPGEGVLSRIGMSTLGRNDFDRLNAGLDPGSRISTETQALLGRTGTDGGALTIVNHNDFSGSYIDSEHTANLLTEKVGKRLAEKLRKSADMRDRWRTPIKGIAGSGL